MKTLLWVVVVFNQLFLLLVGAMRFSRYSVSEFAFSKQLLDMKKQEVQLHKKIYKKLPSILALQRIELVIASTILVILFSVLVGPLLAIAYSLASFFIVWQLTKLMFIRQKAEQLFMRSTNLIFTVLSYLQPLFRLFGSAHRPQLHQPTSFAEFKDTLRRLPSTVLTPKQRQKLETVLASEEKTVKDCMTPKKQVTAVEPSATLGPIVLSDLQKTNHGYFPVVTKKGDVEGMLRLSDVADIASAKQRSTVSELLSTHITWIDQSASLEAALQLFLHEKQYLLFVHDDANEWSGIITAADLVKHAIGFYHE